MDRLRTFVIVLVTAIVTCALTSAFWLVSFNGGRPAQTVTPGGLAVEPGKAEKPPLVLGPGGLAIPVALGDRFL